MRTDVRGRGDRSNEESAEQTRKRSELFVRPVPAEYAALIRDAKFFGSTESFGHRLDEAVIDGRILTKKERASAGSRPMISKERFASAERSEFGNAVRDAVRGNQFVDLGNREAGDPTPRLMAEAFGAREYIGVDATTSQEKTIMGALPATYLKDDILSFLSKLGPRDGVVFFLSGVQPFTQLREEVADAFRNSGNSFERERARQHDITAAYSDACLEEMRRVTRPGDSILIGMGTHGFDPTRHGFRLVRNVELEGFQMLGLYTRE